jgi:hypothetical protein
MKTVTKKIVPHAFEKVTAGPKRFELRVADFDIADGDTLRLEEWTSTAPDRKPTGRAVEKRASYVHKVDLKAWLAEQPDLLEHGFYVIQIE